MSSMTAPPSGPRGPRYILRTLPYGDLHQGKSGSGNTVCAGWALPLSDPIHNTGPHLRSLTYANHSVSAPKFILAAQSLREIVPPKILKRTDYSDPPPRPVPSSWKPTLSSYTGPWPRKASFSANPPTGPEDSLSEPRDRNPLYRSSSG